ncbi:Rho GTPase activation protein, partial [Thamnidium elegans]
RSLPSSLQQEINQFAIDGFANKYFATHKRGLFRRAVPMNELLSWTKDSIKQPLLLSNKNYKDALKSFKALQLLMHDRQRPRQFNSIETFQSLLNCGITKGQMRDEIYVQICRQLNKNPRGSSIRKGWEILCVISVTFPPSKNLESYLFHFVEQHHTIKANQVDVMSEYVSAKLARICSRGARGKVLSAAEIERAMEAPFKPSVFGESLDVIMDQQKEDTLLKIPKIVTFLTNAVHELNGQSSEGIFRVPGDADAVTELRIRIENGNYDSTGIDDPNVPASLLKYWLRDLSEPLIPSYLYDECIAHAHDKQKSIAIIHSLPEINRRIVLYMIRFLQDFADPKVIELTLMNIFNLAMVFAPNFLRCPSVNLTTIFENSKYEQIFLKTLINEIKIDKEACAFHDQL